MRKNDDEVLNNPTVTNTAIWVFGRLDELVKKGTLESGDHRITDKGRKEYRELVLSGFIPDPGVVASFLLMLFSREQADAALFLVMTGLEDNSKN
jgi:hypothetical protein